MPRHVLAHQTTLTWMLVDVMVAHPVPGPAVAGLRVQRVLPMPRWLAPYVCYSAHTHSQRSTSTCWFAHSVHMGCKGLTTGLSVDL